MVGRTVRIALVVSGLLLLLTATLRDPGTTIYAFLGSLAIALALIIDDEEI